MDKAKPAKIENLLPLVREYIQSGLYRDTIHAQLRRDQRGISLPEVINVLRTGRHEKSKDQFDKTFFAWNYAIRGFTADGFDMRVIVSFDEERGLLIITAFYLD